MALLPHSCLCTSVDQFQKPFTDRLNTTFAVRPTFKDPVGPTLSVSSNLVIF